MPTESPSNLPPDPPDRETSTRGSTPESQPQAEPQAAAGHPPPGTAAVPSTLEEPWIEGLSYIPSSAHLTGQLTHTFKDHELFGVVDQRGNCPRETATRSELGVYYRDTRHLSVWEWFLNGHAPVPLSKELRADGSALVLSMTNRDLPAIGESAGGRIIPRDTLLIRRFFCAIEDTLFEILSLKNFSAETRELELEHWAGSRFEDIFEVRGMRREKRGRLLAPREDRPPEISFSLIDEAFSVRPSGSALRRHELSYEGLDGIVRRTTIDRYFPTATHLLQPGVSAARTRVRIQPKAEVNLRTVVTPEPRERPHPARRLLEFLMQSDLREFLHDAVEARVTRKAQTLEPLKIQTDDSILNRALERTASDIRMLLSERGTSRLYPQAGIPWFSAPFGRDGLITAYQLLPWDFEIARDVIDTALASQGTRDDPFTEEQPGKIFHELREGEMARLREIPFIPYYGSADATPLLLILVAEYLCWSGDLPSIRRWWPQLVLALRWINEIGDSDGDGFIEYERRNPSGLVNQGWKDSHDSVMHADGSLARPPIRLVEIQAYAHRARLAMADIADRLGDRPFATRLRQQALSARARFIESFWDPADGMLHLALDGERVPCQVKSSNMGQCLWGRILSPEQAQRIAGWMISDTFFSGYGIRTLADGEAAYNPMSYHNGSVWPHDNSLILEGMRLHGCLVELQKAGTAMIEVLRLSPDFRMPELFCGFKRRLNEAPVPYEVACRPQAWASGAIFLALKAMLGISADIDQEHLIIRPPLLPAGVNELSVHGLRLREWTFDLAFVRSGTQVIAEILRKSPGARAVIVRE